MSLHQLNSDNNGPVLLFKTIIRPVLNCFLSSGLKLVIVGPVFCLAIFDNFFLTRPFEENFMYGLRH